MSNLRIHKNSVYAPIRFQAIKSLALKCEDVTNFKGQNIETIEDFSDCYVPLYEMYKQNFDYIDDTVHDFLNFQAMHDVCYEVFRRQGKVIYDINNLVTSCLEHSDIQDISCDQLVLPNRAFYIYFDSPSLPMEGVYILGLEGYVCVLPVAKGCYRNTKVKLASKEDEPIFLIFQLHQGENISSSYEKMLNDMLIRHNGTVSDVFRKTQGNCLKLVINAILYINSQSKDVEYDWSRDVPPSRIKAISYTKSVHKKAIQEKALRTDGYSKVRYVGRQYEKSTEGTHLKQFFQHTDRRGMSTHFRRGHFRNQVCGKEFKDRKIVYIAPTIVNPYATHKKGKVFTL